jgi:HPt (histidine-containing phosphotransfer) domain-containing protein
MSDAVAVQPVYDREDAMERLGGDAELCDDILKHLLLDIPRIVTQLDQATQSGDMPGLTDLAHGLKGAARNVGAKALGMAAYALEMAGRERKTEAIRSALASLHRDVEELGRVAATRFGSGGEFICGKS